jgi:hypothetical protein
MLSAAYTTPWQPVTGGSPIVRGSVFEWIQIPISVQQPRKAASPPMCKDLMFTCMHEWGEYAEAPPATP